jgi:hypothetical protein
MVYSGTVAQAVPVASVIRARVVYCSYECRACGSLGALNHAIVVDQFTRLRDGDSWWYENPGVLDVPTLNAVKSTTWVG